MDEAVAALVAQQAELGAILDGLSEADWTLPTRCDGWDVADVVLHLTQTDEMAIGSATGRFDQVLGALTGRQTLAGSVDEGAAAMVEGERGLAVDRLLHRWHSNTEELVGVLDSMDLSTRVAWVAGQLSARTLATTRLAETWIHTGDVTDAVGMVLPATDRLRLVARLAWRTLPYAFSSGGRQLHGPVAFHLTGPAGDPWDYVPDDEAVTTITGPAVELCEVAARRLDPSTTSLTGVGPDAETVLDIIRTYA
jgi:uncharacterized protein (TIGR03084 family)